MICGSVSASNASATIRLEIARPRPVSAASIRRRRSTRSTSHPVGTAKRTYGAHAKNPTAPAAVADPVSARTRSGYAVAVTCEPSTETV
jgi:hypothetical protein